MIRGLPEGIPSVHVPSSRPFPGEEVYRLLEEWIIGVPDSQDGSP